MGVRSQTRKLKGKAAEGTRRTLAKIPGPSTNPATNLIILDVAIRGAALAAGRGMERALLRTRYPGTIGIKTGFTGKAGLVFVTINPAYRPFELKYVLRQSDSVALAASKAVMRSTRR